MKKILEIIKVYNCKGNILKSILIFGLIWQTSVFAQQGLVKTYYPDYTIKSEINYVDSVRSGIAKFYYPNGKIKSEMNYVNGKVDGVVKEYYENGNLELIYSIEDGMRNGAESFFDEKGNYLKDISYKDGKLIPVETTEIDTTSKLASVLKDSGKADQKISEEKITKLKNEAAQVTAPPDIKDKIENPDYLTSAEVMPEPAGGMSTIMKKLVYPESAKKDKIQGTVKIRAFIDEYGEVTQDEVVQGIGHGCDEAAKIAVYYTSFTPGLIRGKPVKVQVVVPVEFKLPK